MLAIRRSYKMISWECSCQKCSGACKSIVRGSSFTDCTGCGSIFHPDDLHHILEQAAREWFGCENPVFTPVLRCIDRNGRLVNVQVSWHSFTHVERLDPLEVSHNVIMTFEVQQ